jgi:hypothetical protein
MKVKHGLVLAILLVVSLLPGLLGCVANASDVRRTVSGTVVGGGDQTPPGGPMDAPRTYVYSVKAADGTLVNVSYVAYPPSPAGDAARARIVLDFDGGSVEVGDRLEASGAFNKATNTVEVALEGDYIRTTRSGSDAPG